MKESGDKEEKHYQEVKYSIIICIDLNQNEI